MLFLPAKFHVDELSFVSVERGSAPIGMPVADRPSDHCSVTSGADRRAREEPPMSLELRLPTAERGSARYRGLTSTVVIDVKQ